MQTSTWCCIIGPLKNATMYCCFVYDDRNLCYPLFCFFFNISSSQLELMMLLCTLLTVTADRFVDDVILIIAGRVGCELNLSFCQQSTLWWRSIAPRLSEENSTFNSGDLMSFVEKIYGHPFIHIENHSRTIISLIKFIIHCITCMC